MARNSAEIKENLLTGEMARSLLGFQQPHNLLEAMMELYDHRIPNANIWAAARLTLATFGPNAFSIIGETISDMEKQGYGEQARAWRTVVEALETLSAGESRPAEATVH